MMSKPRAIGRDGTKEAQPAELPAGPLRAGCTAARLNGLPCRPLRAAAAKDAQAPSGRRRAQRRRIAVRVHACACRPLRADGTKEAQPAELPAGRPRAGCTAARLNGLPCRPLRAVAAKDAQAPSGRRGAQRHRIAVRVHACPYPPLRVDGTKEAQPAELPAGPLRAGCTAARLNGLPCRPLRADGTSKHGPIAQRLEPPAHNRPVPGSNPGGPTNSLSMLGRWWLTRLWVSGADVVGPTVTNPGGPTNSLSMLGRWWLTRLWVTGADVVGVFLLRFSPFHLAPPASR